MQPRTVAYLREAFSRYYKIATIEVPSIARREFGIGSPEKKIVRRHLTFPSNAALLKFLRRETPFYVSYSVARYEMPAAQPMERKHFLGADIVLEFDADDIPTRCKAKHDTWHCPACGSSGAGSPALCDSCGRPVKVQQWFCEQCLDAAKQELSSLLTILTEELGFTAQHMHANFSGNAGYHLHLRHATVQQLSQRARAQLADYLLLTNISWPEFGFVVRNNALTCPALDKAKGLKKRIMHALYEFVRDTDGKQLAMAGNVQPARIRELISNREALLSAISKGTLPFPGRPTSAQRFWYGVLDYVSRTLKLHLDRQSTIDMSRLIRVPNTIHGSTGLAAKTFHLSKLNSFEPMKHAVLFTNAPVKIFINKAPEFELAGQRFGPFNEEEAELPEYAAIFLMAKGRAELVGG
jgi:DNA primase small subunit